MLVKNKTDYKKMSPISSKQVIGCIKLKNKYPFVLLEILIALTLVTSCMLYTLVSPVEIYKHEKKLIQETEYERIIDLSFTEIRERLYLETKDHTLTKMVAGHVFTLPKVQLNLPNIHTEIHRSYSFSIEKTDAPKTDLNGHKTTENKLIGAHHLLLKIDLKLEPVGATKPTTASQKLFVKKKLQDPLKKEV